MVSFDVQKILIRSYLFFLIFPTVEDGSKKKKNTADLCQRVSFVFLLEFYSIQSSN